MGATRRGKEYQSTSPDRTRNSMVPPHPPKDATLTGVTHGLGRVLVVDDDEVIRRLIAVNLQLEGFDVETAVDGQDCLERVTEIDPDVITLDVMMPRLDGWATAIQLRKSGDRAHQGGADHRPGPGGRQDPRQPGRRRRLPDQALRPERDDPRRPRAGRRRQRVITAGLRQAILAAAGAGAGDPLLRPGPVPGSYATALPFRLTSAPREAAARLAGKLRAEPWVATAEVTGPGFVTVTVTHDTLAGLAVRIAQAGP